MVNSVEEEEVEETGARMMDDGSSIGSWIDDVEEEEDRRSRAFSLTSSSSDQVLSSSSCYVSSRIKHYSPGSGKFYLQQYQRHWRQRRCFLDSYLIVKVIVNCRSK